MAGRIEDYAIIGDMQAALVCSDGSIYRLCLPRFDAGACFAAPPGSGDDPRVVSGAETGTHRSAA